MDYLEKHMTVEKAKVIFDAIQQDVDARQVGGGYPYCQGLEGNASLALMAYDGWLLFTAFAEDRKTWKGMGNNEFAVSKDYQEASRYERQWLEYRSSLVEFLDSRPDLKAILVTK